MLGLVLLFAVLVVSGTLYFPEGLGQMSFLVFFDKFKLRPIIVNDCCDLNAVIALLFKGKLIGSGVM